VTVRRSHPGTARTLPGVLRRIVGFAADDVGDWVALLECHHRQHVRHRPPFRMASWVKEAAERDRHIGTPLDCPLCDRCEIPAGLTVTRTTATWDERTMPDALRRAHRVGAGRGAACGSNLVGVLCVIDRSEGANELTAAGLELRSLLTPADLGPTA
jgi:Protein of unknown function (DUF3565)